MGEKIDAAGMPIIILIVWGLISLFISIPIPSIGLVTTIISLIIMAWIGYNSREKFNMDVKDSAITTGIAATISGVIIFIISLGVMMTMPEVAVGLGMIGSLLGGAFAGLMVIMAIIGIIVSIIYNFIVGAILGAIGATIAGGKK